ncbi:CRISPR-associated protein Cas4 [Bacillota bacterium LX-D]|nr:CRISPR-associated protein Cas4 [Bacillota bacterium LX-D]
MYKVNDRELLNPSEVIEFLYCPRFIYYMRCLKIPQNEHNRFKVMKGRDIHQYKSQINKEYVRKKIACTKKEIDIFLHSKKLGLKGKVDEVLQLADGTMAPLDYKFAEYKGVIYSTYRIQALIYGALISENYEKPVYTGYLCYIRSKNYLAEIKFTQRDWLILDAALKDMRKIIEENYYPKATKYKARCVDCCYKNICVEGLEASKSLEISGF